MALLQEGEVWLSLLQRLPAREDPGGKKIKSSFSCFVRAKSITFGLQPLAASNQSTLTRAHKNCWLEESFVK